MDYLEEFKWKISLVDGMLIETGEIFGEKKKKEENENGCKGNGKTR